MMKYAMMTALAAAQLAFAAQPAAAAELIDKRGETGQRHGAFAGARLRVPLGGEADRKARAGLTVAPIVQDATMDGSRAMRFGEGLELGMNGRDRPVLAFGGRPVSQIAMGRTGPDGRRLGTSTTTGLLIVGGIVIVSLGGFLLLISN